MGGMSASSDVASHVRNTVTTRSTNKNTARTRVAWFSGGRLLPNQACRGRSRGLSCRWGLLTRLTMHACDWHRAGGCLRRRRAPTLRPGECFADRGALPPSPGGMQSCFVVLRCHLCVERAAHSLAASSAGMK